MEEGRHHDRPALFAQVEHPGREQHRENHHEEDPQEAVFGVVVAQEVDERRMPGAPDHADVERGGPEAQLAGALPEVTAPHQLFAQREEQVDRRARQQRLDDQRRPQGPLGQARRLGAAAGRDRLADLGEPHVAVEGQAGGDAGQAEEHRQQPGGQPPAVGARPDAQAQPLAPGEHQGDDAGNPHVDQAEPQEPGAVQRPHLRVVDREQQPAEDDGYGYGSVGLVHQASSAPSGSALRSCASISRARLGASSTCSPVWSTSKTPSPAARPV